MAAKLDRDTVLTTIRTRAAILSKNAEDRRASGRDDDAHILEAKATVLAELHYDLASFEYE